MYQFFHALRAGSRDADEILRSMDVKNLVQNLSLYSKDYSIPTIKEVGFCPSFFTDLKKLVQNLSLCSTEYNIPTIKEVGFCTSFFTL